MDRTRIIVADGQGMFRECLIDHLAKEPDLEIVGHTADVSTAVLLARDVSPEVVLMATDMPGRPFVGGGRIISLCPRTKVIFLGTSCADRYVARSIEVGARGYVLKGQRAERVLEAIRNVAAGKLHFVPEVLARLAVDGKTLTSEARPATRSSRLTHRELEVLSLLAEGLRVRQVAANLGVSYKTVDNQTLSLMKKLDIHSRAQLIRYAIREELTIV